MQGVILLSFYSLGLAIPFILSGFYMNRFLVSKKGFGKYFKRISITGGLILLLTGVLIVTNQIQVISFFILTHFSIFNDTWLMSDICVLGNFVADNSFYTNELPKKAKQFLALAFKLDREEKDLIKQLQQRDLEAKVSFLGKVGNDEYGKMAIELYKK